MMALPYWDWFFLNLPKLGHQLPDAISLSDTKQSMTKCCPQPRSVVKRETTPLLPHHSIHEAQHLSDPPITAHAKGPSWKMQKVIVALQHLNYFNCLQAPGGHLASATEQGAPRPPASVTTFFRLEDWKWKEENTWHLSIISRSRHRVYAYLGPTVVTHVPSANHLPAPSWPPVLYQSAWVWQAHMAKLCNAGGHIGHFSLLVTNSSYATTRVIVTLMNPSHQFSQVTSEHRAQSRNSQRRF